MSPAKKSSDTTKPKKEAPDFFKPQQTLLKMIKEHENINHKDAIKRLKYVIKEKTGIYYDDDYKKQKDKKTWLELLNKTIDNYP